MLKLPCQFSLAMKKKCVRDNFRKKGIKWEKFRGGGGLYREAPRKNYIQKERVIQLIQGVAKGKVDKKKQKKKLTNVSFGLTYIHTT